MTSTAARPSLARILSMTSAMMALLAGAAGAQEAGKQARKAAEGESTLDTVIVTAKDGADPYQVPDSVSHVAPEQVKQQRPSRPDAILRTVPGVFTQSAVETPGVSVNIRSMQDFGRVNVMIDGARQNFQYSGHGPNGTVFIDPALIRSVDVAKGTVATEGGAGAIGGAVNFRTLELEDILTGNKNYGAEATIIHGGNGYNWSEVFSTGIRDDRFSVFGTLSLRDSGNYKDGADMEVEQTGQKLMSGLGKFGVQLDPHQRLDLGAVYYDNEFAKASADYRAKVLTTTAKYHFDPAGELIDLRLNAFYNRTELGQEFNKDFIKGSTVDFADDGIGGDISNVSRFTLGDIGITAKYGAEGFYDWVKAEADGPDQTAPGLTPKGERGVFGLFFETTASWKRFELIAAARVDHYVLTGEGVNDVAPGGPPGIPGFPSLPGLPAGPFEVDTSATAVSPKFTAAYRPLDWLQLYGLYGWGFRPPAITETLMSGVHPGGVNFVRFTPNPFLDPERSEGWELGVNLAYDGLFNDRDRLRLKVNYFANDIEDYIVGAANRCSRGICFFYRNADETSHVEGFEIEGSYDLGMVFASFGYQDIETDVALANFPGLGYLPITPDRVFNTTLGFRLFDERLTLGLRRQQVSQSQYLNNGVQSDLPGYTLYDVFTSFAVNENLDVFLNIENLKDLDYVPAMTTDPDRYHGPGFTAKFGVSARL
jgi:hemoglobin/transferrin/lactoferrin receptor protein